MCSGSCSVLVKKTCLFFIVLSIKRSTKDLCCCVIVSFSLLIKVLCTVAYEDKQISNLNFSWKNHVGGFVDLGIEWLSHQLQHSFKTDRITHLNIPVIFGAKKYFYKKKTFWWLQYFTHKCQILSLSLLQSVCEFKYEHIRLPRWNDFTKTRVHIRKMALQFNELSVAKHSGMI